MKIASRWLLIGLLVAVLPAKLFFVDLWRWIELIANQADLALGVPQLLALMIGEVSFVVALAGASVFIGLRALQTGTVPRMTALYFVMAVLAYHLLRPYLFDTPRRLQRFVEFDELTPDLEIWIAAAAWIYGAVLTWCSLFLRTEKVQA